MERRNERFNSLINGNTAHISRATMLLSARINLDNQCPNEAV